MITDASNAENVGQVDCPAFPSYPQFLEVPAPLAMLRGTAIQAKRAWQGLLQPFADDEDARLALRALAMDEQVDVSAGRITTLPKIHSRPAHDAEFRLHNSALVFDVLVLDFSAPAHPWAFSLAPVISKQKHPSHPHLRCDRTLVLPSRNLSGMCVYSAAEFKYDAASPRIPQFLDQVSIYLAKHIIWLKTQRLFNLDTRAIVHDGLNLDTLYQNIPSNTLWQKQPQLRTIWLGLWPGREAASGTKHLSLDPREECWCGKGLTYEECCRPIEIKQYGVEATVPMPPAI